MAVVKFHSHLKEQKDEAQFAEQLERLLGFLGKEHRPIRWPDGAESGRAEQNARRNFADGQRLIQEAFTETAKRPCRGDDHRPLQQDQFKMLLDDLRIHKRLANTPPQASKQEK